MNMTSLRKWIRNELEPDERRTVGRWILRATDPGLPALLFGLIREHEEELADAALRARTPERSFVIDLWRRLLDAGSATIDELRPRALAGGAVLGTASTSSGIRFRSVGSEVAVDIVLVGPSHSTALFATTDQGDEHMLLAPTQLVPGTYVDVARWTPEADEGRVTVWLVLVTGPVGGTGMQGLADAARLVATGDARVIASRWADPA